MSLVFSHSKYIKNDNFQSQHKKQSSFAVVLYIYKFKINEECTCLVLYCLDRKHKKQNTVRPVIVAQVQIRNLLVAFYPYSSPRRLVVRISECSNKLSLTVADRNINLCRIWTKMGFYLETIVYLKCWWKFA